MIEAYPLCWPMGQKRTAIPERSRFGAHTLSQVTKILLKEIERMKGKNAIISTNIPLRLSGIPRADYQKRQITDKGVAVYFMRNNTQVVLACDKWDSIEDNIYAIALTIEAMRSLDRWGVSEMLDRAFNGFAALPAPGQSQSKSCWDVLGISVTGDKGAIKAAYNSLGKTRHPDKGGSHEAMSELNEAYRDAITFADNF